MALFGKKQESGQNELMIGVDIGTTGIKMVVLKPEGGKPRLVTYAEAQVKNAGEMPASFVKNKDNTVAIMRSLAQKLDVGNGQVTGGLSASDVFSTILSVPALPVDGFTNRVMDQAKKVSPFPLDDMILDSTPLPQPQDVSYTRTLVTGAPKTLIETYADIYGASGLRATALETEVFALIRALLGPDPSPALIVDIGGDRTTIIIARSGVPYLVRSITHAGVAMTRALAKQAGLSFMQAESMKRDFAYAADQSLPQSFIDTIEPIVHEIKYALDLYTKQEFHDQATVDKVLVTGGMAGIGAIAKILNQALQLNTYIGDPFAFIAAPTEARTVLEEVGPRLAVAAGLALREFEKHPGNI